MHEHSRDHPGHGSPYHLELMNDRYTASASIPCILSSKSQILDSTDYGTRFRAMHAV